MLHYQTLLRLVRSIEVAGLLARMRDNRCDACAMEISSHALDQGRVAGMRFGGAAFTNLGVTGDHLDYHKTMDNYAAAKARLFEMLDGASVAVVNTGDTWSERMVRDCRARVVRFGLILAGAAALEVVEPTTIRGGYLDGVWWAIVTASTVGYGDIAPSTPGGRIIAIVLMLAGIGLISTFSASVTSYFVGQQEASDLQEMRERLARMEKMLEELTRKNA